MLTACNRVPGAELLQASYQPIITTFRTRAWVLFAMKLLGMLYGARDQSLTLFSAEPHQVPASGVAMGFLQTEKSHWYEFQYLVSRKI